MYQCQECLKRFITPVERDVGPGPNEYWGAYSSGKQMVETCPHCCCEDIVDEGEDADEDTK